MSKVIDATDPANIKEILNEVPWGTIHMSGVTFISCPWCLAMMIPAFTNAHEIPADRTPKSMHIEYHLEVAHAAKRLAKGVWP